MTFQNGGLCKCDRKHKSSDSIAVNALYSTIKIEIKVKKVIPELQQFFIKISIRFLIFNILNQKI